MSDILVSIISELPVAGVLLVVFWVVGKKAYSVLEAKENGYKQTIDKVIEMEREQRREDRETFKSTIANIITETNRQIDRNIDTQKSFSKALHEKLDLLFTHQTELMSAQLTVIDSRLSGMRKSIDEKGCHGA